MGSSPTEGGRRYELWAPTSFPPPSSQVKVFSWDTDFLTVDLCCLTFQETALEASTSVVGQVCPKVRCSSEYLWVYDGGSYDVSSMITKVM